MKNLLLLLLCMLTLMSMQNDLSISEIKKSGQIAFGTFYRQARSWIYGESTDETRSSWRHVESVTSWYHAIVQSAKESSWWFPSRTENIRETSLGVPEGTSIAIGTSWWTYGWASAWKHWSLNLADTFQSVSTYLRDNRWVAGLEELKLGATDTFNTVLTYLRDCRWCIGLENLKSSATEIFNTVSTYLRDCRWWPGLEKLKSSATEIFNTVTQYLETQYLEKNIWVLILAFLVVVASLAIWWWYKSVSKARKKQLRRELELVPDTRMVAYLKYITNDFNISENATSARPSHSDESLLTSIGSVTETQDQPESQVPVNFLPTVNVEFTVTYTQNIIWFERATADYY